MRVRWSVVAILLLVGAVGIPAAVSGEPVRAEELPGYYEFFMKTGRLVRIKDEVVRDERIAAGELAPVRVREDLPEFALLTASGDRLSLSAYRGSKNLVLVSFRSWW